MNWTQFSHSLSLNNSLVVVMSPRCQTRQVLIAASAPEIGRLIAVNLALEGFDVTMASDGPVYLKVADCAAPAVVLLASPFDPAELTRVVRVLAD